MAGTPSMLSLGMLSTLNRGAPAPTPSTLSRCPTLASMFTRPSTLSRDMPLPAKLFILCLFTLKKS
ncbi:unnamed protein product, partial [Nesidiocoris tenuis]